MIKKHWLVDKVHYETEDMRAQVTLRSVNGWDRIKLSMQLDSVDLPDRTRELQFYLLNEATARLAIVTELLSRRETIGGRTRTLI